MIPEPAARVHHLLDRQARERPDAPALRETGGAGWSFGDLDRASRDLARGLDLAGVRPGDRVMIACENCLELIAALFACYRLGAIAVPVNARLTAAEIGAIRDHARPAAMLYTARVSPDAAAHADRERATEIRGSYGTLRLSRPAPSAPDDDADVAVMLFTTGTTGTPKGVMLTHRNLCFAAMASVERRKITAQDLIYGVLPVSHVFGLASIVTAAMSAGACLWLEPRFSAARLYDALTRGVTLFSGVPQMHALLMQYTREQGHDRLPCDTLRYVTSGGAPLDPAWKRKAEAFYGRALQNGYGLTETTAGVTVTTNALGDPDTSVGPPVMGVEIGIDETVPGGGDGMGEVLTRGPHVMKGYYRNSEATAKVLDGDGWFHTGDLGRVDDRGFLHILGRSKELIIHGGFNVYPPEVEAALNAHPQVIQCAVIGRAVDGDEQVLAFVQAAPDDLPIEADLQAFAARRLAGYKRPARIVVATALPAAATGKILKHKLIETFAEHLD